MDSIKQKSSQKPSTRSILELTFAGFLWGFGFVGTIWALQYLSPSAILFYRFGIAFLAGFAILVFSRVPRETIFHELKLTFVPAILIWASLLFQTYGLQYTTAINSSFITTMYVIIVPLLRFFTHKERLHWMHWLCVIVAILGTALIVDIQNMSKLNWGDVLTFICAILAALHILSVGQRAFQTKNDFAFNVFQSMWISLFSLAAFPFTNRWDLFVMNQQAWIGLLILGFGASLIAFYLQVKAQKNISPSLASLLFLLESPASCFFAFLLLDEKLGGWQWVGAGLILIACAKISLLTPDLSKSPSHL